MKNGFFFSSQDIVPKLTGSEIHGKGIGTGTRTRTALDAGAYHIPDGCQ
jgi:hypothetical protein